MLPNPGQSPEETPEDGHTHAQGLRADTVAETVLKTDPRVEDVTNTGISQILDRTHIIDRIQKTEHERGNKHFFSLVASDTCTDR
jgi:hypothetical protein